MFRRVVISLLILITVWSLGPAIASAYQSDNVRDDLDYLTAEDVQKVQALIDQTVIDHELDIGIVITADTQGKSSRDFADDYYDNNGFGSGTDYSGLLMLINMEEREVWISATGRAIDIFTDSRISGMTDNIAGFLAEGSYYDACLQFVDEVAYFAAQGVPQGQYRVDSEVNAAGEGQAGAEASKTYMSRVIRKMTSPLVFLGALVIAGLATFRASRSSKGSITINNQTYEDQGSFVLSEANEYYIREYTSSVRIADNSSKSNRSSTIHKSSSGRTHGGGGRKF